VVTPAALAAAMICRLRSACPRYRASSGLPFGAGQGRRQARVGTDHQELVAAGARHQVVGAQTAFQGQRHLPQHQVAGVVAESVIDLFELVEVHHQAAEAAATAARRRPRHSQDNGGARASTQCAMERRSPASPRGMAPPCRPSCRPTGSGTQTTSTQGRGCAFPAGRRLPLVQAAHAAPHTLCALARH
jgi:hypothetical protein